MKKKGFTTVELVVSFALVMTIAVLLFQVVLNLKNLYVNSGMKTQLLNKQAIITNQINERLLEKKIDSYTSCGEDCLRFVYMDGTSEDLIVNKQEKYIEFADNRTYLIDKSNFGSIVLDTYTTPVFQDYHNDSMLIINLPIYYNNDTKKDYGVRIVYQYNSKGSNIVPPDRPVQNDLALELKKQYNESNTTGLLKDPDSDSYYYKGTNEEVSNNFVWFGGHLWRVLTINEDNSLTMITQQPITSIHPASSVWTTKEEYAASYINTWLNEVFLGSMNDSDKAKIQDNTYNIGITGNISEITTTEKVGLLDEDQYIKAGGQNSFLDIKDSWWLGNRDSSSTLDYVLSDGSLNVNSPLNASAVRPIIKIFNLILDEGEGTISNPYREKSSITNIVDIKVGEYISVPTSGTDCGEDNRCLFRVVSKDKSSIKVTLNGLLSSTSQFGTNPTYKSGNIIDTVVKNFVNTINNKYQYIGNKSFSIGEYGYGTNYKIVQNATYTGTNGEPVNVGLPVIGEMFTGNDIDISASTSKVFINVSTIENSTASASYWTMNAYRSSSDVRTVDSSGYLSNGTNPQHAFGVRPVLFLNNNLTFTGGEGTAENPFTLG